MRRQEDNFLEIDELSCKGRSMGKKWMRRKWMKKSWMKERLDEEEVG